MFVSTVKDIILYCNVAKTPEGQGYLNTHHPQQDTPPTGHFNRLPSPCYLGWPDGLQMGFTNTETQDIQFGGPLSPNHSPSPGLLPRHHLSEAFPASLCPGVQCLATSLGILTSVTLSLRDHSIPVTVGCPLAMET